MFTAAGSTWLSGENTPSVHQWLKDTHRVVRPHPDMTQPQEGRDPGTCPHVDRPRGHRAQGGDPDPEGHLLQDPTPRRSPEEARPQRQRGGGGSRGGGRGVVPVERWKVLETVGGMHGGVSVLRALSCALRNN